jgi:hypothetical protein
MCDSPRTGESHGLTIYGLLPMRQTLAFSPGKVAVKQDGDALVMEFTTGALKLSPWDGEIFTATTCA